MGRHIRLEQTQQNLEEGVVLMEGPDEGPVSVVLAGVHGDEKCGVNAFQDLLPTLYLQRGKVFFILGNPRAIELDKRYMEFNLNRGFLEDSHYPESVRSTYEYDRASLIKSYLDRATALLDIHSTLHPSDPFIFCEPTSFSIAKVLPGDFKLIVTGVESIEPGGADGYMSRRGKIGICLECGQHRAPHVKDLAKRSLLAFLKARGHFAGEKADGIGANGTRIVELNFGYYTQTDSFRLVREFGNFEPIEEGTPIGKDGGKLVTAPRDGLIVFAKDCHKKNTEGFLFGKEIIG